MFPIRDHNPSDRTPFVTYALVAVNVGVFLAMLPLMADERALYEVYWQYGLVPVKVIHGEGLHGIFTSMFLHGGFMHLAGNMLFLWIFGDNLEDRMGHGRFLLFYLLAGAGAGLLQMLPAPTTPVPLIGASGAIAGVMGGYLLLFPRARVDVIVIFVVFYRIFALPAWMMLGLWFGLQIFNGVGAPVGEGGVAYWAHAGGFVVGVIGALPVWRSLGGPEFWARTHGHPDNPPADPRLRPSSVPKVRRR